MSDRETVGPLLSAADNPRPRPPQIQPYVAPARPDHGLAPRTAGDRLRPPILSSANPRSPRVAQRQS